MNCDETPFVFHILKLISPKSCVFVRLYDVCASITPGTIVSKAIKEFVGLSARLALSTLRMLMPLK